MSNSRSRFPLNVWALLLCLALAPLSGTLVAQARAKSSPDAAVAAVTPDTTVFVTKTGTKYHTAGCRSLSKSKIPMRLGDAAEKYGACSICRPPTLATTERSGIATTSPSSSVKTSPPNKTATSRQCAATTKAGTRCKRNASPGSAYCWQHGKTH